MRLPLISPLLWKPGHSCWLALCGMSLLAMPVLSLEPGRSASAGEPKTVTVSVVDEGSGKPISLFAYSIAIVTTDLLQSDEPGPWQSVESATGKFRVQTPQSCELRVTVRARGYCNFWGYEEITQAFLIRSQDQHPGVQMKIERGQTVKGTVRDAETGEPIAGARVRPYVFAAPLMMPDSRRWVTTDRLGKFELPGVMVGSGDVRVEHPRYSDTDVRFLSQPEGEEADFTLEFKLRPVPGGPVTGRVSDPVGRPLQGVAVTDGCRASTESDGQGRFVLEHVQGATRDGKFELTAQKKGFFAVTDGIRGCWANDVTLTLRPLPEWNGQVLSPEGLPVTKFSVQVAPLNDSSVKQVPVRHCVDPEGRFAMVFEQIGPNWLAVNAAGYAPWQKTIEVGEHPESLAVRLERGVTVMGQVRGPFRRPREVQVVLMRVGEAEPSRGTGFSGTAEIVDEAMQRVAQLKTPLDDGGEFRIENVRAGNYELKVSGPGTTADGFWVVVAAHDVSLGILKVRGTGRVVGQVFPPADGTDHAPWPFVRGEIHSVGAPEGVEFITDEDGRFAVEDAPVGRASVDIVYMATADMGACHSRAVQVVEGRESQVWFARPPGTPDLPLEFVVGDGSEAHRLAGLGLRESRPAPKDDPYCEEKPHLSIELFPPKNVPVAIPPTATCRIDRPGVTSCPLRGIPKGRYRLQVRTRCCEPLFEQDLAVTERTIHAPPIRIRLGAASITGTIEPVDSRSSVYAVPENQKQRLQTDDHAFFDDTWAFRFLADGKYAVVARDPKRGWARRENLAVAAGKITDAGALHLSPGGVIQGRIMVPTGQAVPGDVVATDPHGIAVSESTGMSFSIPSLWPGRWTVRLLDRGGDRVLASGTATIVATETAQCDLTVHP